MFGSSSYFKLRLILSNIKRHLSILHRLLQQACSGSSNHWFFFLSLFSRGFTSCFKTTLSSVRDLTISAWYFCVLSSYFKLRLILSNIKALFRIEQSELTDSFIIDNLGYRYKNYMLVVFSSLVERCLLRLRFDQLYRVLPGFQLRFRCFHHAKVHWIRMCNQIDNLRFKGQPFTGFSTGFFFRSSCQRDLKGPAALLIQAGDARGGGAVAGFLKRRRVALASRRQRHGDLRLVDVDGRCFGKRRSGGK